MTTDELLKKVSSNMQEPIKKLEELAKKAEQEAQQSKEFHKAHVERIIKK